MLGQASALLLNSLLARGFFGLFFTSCSHGDFFRVSIIFCILTVNARRQIADHSPTSLAAIVFALQPSPPFPFTYIVPLVLPAGHGFGTLLACRRSRVSAIEFASVGVGLSPEETGVLAAFMCHQEVDAVEDESITW